MKLRIKLKYLLLLAFIPLLIAIVKSAEYGTGSVAMNATISSQVVSITVSDAISSGILFGSIQPGSTNNMAINDTTGAGNATNYYITNDASSTSSVNMWHKATDNLLFGSNIIMIGNITHEANQSSSGYNVNMTLTTDGTTELTLNYAKIGGASAPCDATAASSNCYVAFWLDVPAVPSGNYETTYSYCANATLGTTSC